MIMNKTKLILVITLSMIFVFLWAKSTSWVRLAKADFYIKEGQTDKALKVYESIFRKEEILSESGTVRTFFKLKPQKEYNVGSFLADYYKNNGDLEKEIKCLKRLAQLKPNEENSYLRLYDIYVSKDDIREATKVVACYEKANSRIFPREMPRDLLWEYNLGKSYLDKGMLEKAEKSFKFCLEKNSKFADVYYLLGAVYQKEGRREEAIEEYRQAVSIAPNHMGSLVALSGLYEKPGAGEGQFIEKRIEELTPPDKADINFSDKIQLLGYDIGIGADKRALFKFWFKCLSEIDRDYLCVIYVKTKDLDLLPPKRKNIGFLCFSDKIAGGTSNWQIGEVYTTEFKRRVKTEKYQVIFFLKSSGGEDSSPMVLRNTATGGRNADLGVIRIF